MRAERREVVVVAAVVAVASLVMGSGTSHASAETTSYRFDFGPGKVESGYLQVVPATVYSKERGYGFDLGSTVTGVDRGGSVVAQPPDTARSRGETTT